MVFVGQVVLEIWHSSRTAHVLHAQLAHSRVSVQRPTGGVGLESKEVPRAVLDGVGVAQQFLSSRQKIILFYRVRRREGDDRGGDEGGASDHAAWVADGV